MLHYWHLTWASSKTSNLLSSSAKLLRQVILVPMVDFLYLDVQLRRFFHLWCVQYFKIHLASSYYYYYFYCVQYVIFLWSLTRNILQDFSMQPPAQELSARDLHDNSWTFRHIYRGILLPMMSYLLIFLFLSLSLQ